jgi:hypothetical protein
LSPFARRRIAEYRQHLLARPEVEPADVAQRAESAAPAPEQLDTLGFEELEELSDEDFLARVIDELAQVPQDGAVDEHTGLSEGQLRMLSPVTRMRLVRGAGHGLRLMLIRDPNPQVAVAVLESGRMSDSEVEAAAANRKVSDEVLTRIGNRREWTRNYKIILNLIRNPRTPIGLALRFLARLSVRDLGLLRTDRGVPDAIRKNADRMFKSKIG